MTLSRIALGLMAATFLAGAAHAADVGPSSLPAVSAVNGKVEFEGGWADVDPGSSDEVFYGGAALSVPLGDAWGLQGDFAVLDVFGETAVGGAAHLFTRDPNSYLLGVVGGYMDSGSGNILWGGAEGELYLDNITIQAVAGLSDSDSNIVGANTGTDFISLVDVSLYATDNMRFIASASTVANFESGGLGFEWLLSDMTSLPVAFKADARFGENDFVSAKAGFAIYFGGNDSNKSLIRRHREDDPEIRAFGGGSGGAVAGAGVLGSNEEPCELNLGKATTTALPCATKTAAFNGGCCIYK